MKTRTMPAGKFKAQCLAVMDEVQKKRQTVVITKRGKPVAKLVPVDTAGDELFGFFQGKGKRFAFDLQLLGLEGFFVDGGSCTRAGGESTRGWRIARRHNRSPSRSPKALF